MFFYDILVYSSSVEDHAIHLTQVLQCLLTNQFYVKLAKCSFCQQSIEYLGHILSTGIVKADPQKIGAMLDWPVPKNVKQL